jgi:parvulin-like peptidyl-prolyl isomerase
MAPMRTIMSISLRALLVAGLAFAGPVGAAYAADDPNEVVARAAGAEIKLGEVREMLRGLDPNMRQQMERDPQILARLLRARLERGAVLNEARSKKWEERPDVQALFEQARSQVILNSYLQSVVKLPDNFPTEGEVQAAYEANKPSLLRPGQYHLAQIFLAFPASADKGVMDALQRRADELARRARTKGTDFAALARESSDHKESAATGGDLGWLGFQQLLPEVRNAVGTMGKGDISLPIRTPSGFHIVRLIESKPSEITPLAEVREQLVASLRQRRFEELQGSYVNALLERGGLAINELALKKAFTGP